MLLTMEMELQPLPPRTMRGTMKGTLQISLLLRTHLMMLVSLAVLPRPLLPTLMAVRIVMGKGKDKQAGVQGVGEVAGEGDKDGRGKAEGVEGAIDPATCNQPGMSCLILRGNCCWRNVSGGSRQFSGGPKRIKTVMAKLKAGGRNEPRGCGKRRKSLEGR